MTVGGTTGTAATGTATMRAFAIDEFGQPGTVRELPVPEPGEGEVLLRVKAAGVNATDLAVMAGWMTEYFQHNFPLVPGIDASGVVEKVGSGVEGFAEGDEVFGYARGPAFGRGTFAPFTVLDVGAMQRKPASLTHEQAAVIAHGALTATAAVDAAAIEPGHRVVILGATGGVGSYATQLATEAGGAVIAVTRGEYADYAKGLGATDVIDYTTTEPAEAMRKSDPDGIDALIDLVGIPELSASMAALVRSGGRVVSIVAPPDVEGLAERGVAGVLTSRWATEDKFPAIASRIANGELKLPPIQMFAYDDLSTALGLQATRHVRGKLAVLVDEA
jgi:NADPH:quinone reductase-like Zn-dependent oxidoreductase